MGKKKGKTSQPQEGEGSSKQGTSLPRKQKQSQHSQTQQQDAQPRGPPPGQFQTQPQQQQQGAWARGPPPGQFQTQPQQQQQGAQPRGPPPGQFQTQPQQQQQGAWARGPPPGQFQTQPQQQQQGAWARGPPPGQFQTQPQQQQQGAQPRGPPPGQFQTQPQQQQQGAQPRGPPPGQFQTQPQQQQQGAQPRRPAPSQKRVPMTSSGGEGDSGEKDGEAPKPTSQPVAESPVKGGSFQFSPRIYAPKKSGKPIEVSTNFFPLIISNPDIEVYHYDVVIEPDKPKHLMRTVWNKYVSLMFPGRGTAFDGKNAYSRGPLTEGTSTVTTVTVVREDKEKEFKVSISEVRKISFACFKDYRSKMLQDRSLKILPEAEIAVLDIILRNFACDNYVRSNRTFFPLRGLKTYSSKDLSDKLCLRFGFFQSAVLGYTPYLNFDISHKAFYKDVPMLKVLENFRNRNGNLDVDAMNHFVRSVKVEYELPNNPASHRVFSVNKLVDSANSQTFTKEDGSKISVAQYFSAEKKIKLRHPDLPLLWVGPHQKTIYVPMEFCKIAPDQVYRGLMDPYETREMVKNATCNARDRKTYLYNIFDEVNINTHPLMKEFELKVSDNMAKLPARILDPPGLKTSRNIRVKEGVWRIQDFLEPVQLNKWCILILDQRVPRQSVMTLQKLLREKGTDFNMRIADAALSPIEGEPSVTALKKAFSQLKDMEMVFVIISEAKGLYSKVKAICETQEGILTQCIKSRTVSQDSRKLSTTVENILLKVNAKLGGKNHCLDKSSVPQCLNGYVMVVGADVTHPSPGMNIPSVAAVAVSCDPAAFQYGTTTRVQPKGEMIRDMEEIMSIHVKRFYEVRGRYPEKIIFFRDGVSEGEMEKVLKGELQAIKKACNPHCQPKITFLVVQKRHHTRFYPTRAEDEQGKNYNVPVGTCVDSEIVHPRELEFYLVSHASILGTARPTRYRLLHDDNKITDDELERLSFYLCHLFSRCNRSVSYPSPTFNAHLAAYRVRAHLEGLNLSGQDITNIQNKMPDRISSISPMFFV